MGLLDIPIECLALILRHLGWRELVRIVRSSHAAAARLRHPRLEVVWTRISAVDPNQMRKNVTLPTAYAACMYWYYYLIEATIVHTYHGASPEGLDTARLELKTAEARYITACCDIYGYVGLCKETLYRKKENLREKVHRLEALGELRRKRVREPKFGEFLEYLYRERKRWKNERDRGALPPP